MDCSLPGSSMGFSRQESWSALPCPPPGDLPDLGMEPLAPASPALQANSLPLSYWDTPTTGLIIPQIISLFSDQIVTNDLVFFETLKQRKGCAFTDILFASKYLSFFLKKKAWVLKGKMTWLGSYRNITRTKNQALTGSLLKMYSDFKTKTKNFKNWWHFLLWLLLPIPCRLVGRHCLEEEI